MTDVTALIIDTSSIVCVANGDDTEISYVTPSSLSKLQQQRKTKSDTYVYQFMIDIVGLGLGIALNV